MGIARLLVATTIFAGLGAASRSALGYDQYSVNGDATNCRACHGDFRATSYTSQTDGLNWGSLHDLHRSTMLSGDCSTCHGSGPQFPVKLNTSAGGSGLAPIGCIGCHGRAEDNTASNPDFGSKGGYGAGLRQHHNETGVTVCASCHMDADPANYTPVGEAVLPPYYANPGTNHPDLPTSSCNPSGSEDYAGLAEGLDNDGDDVYDQSDSDCMSMMDAGPSMSDAAPGMIDAGVVGADAAGAQLDAISSGADAGGGGDEEGGCGCASQGTGSAPGSWLLLALVVLALVRPSRSGERFCQ